MEASALKTAGTLGLRSPTPLLRLQSDERLVGLVRRGNPHAFEALVARYQSRLLAFCRHMLGSREDAEDVLQEVFAASFNAMLADERPINVRPWLYRIARNRSLNHLRRAQAIGVDSMDVHLAEHGTTTADKVHRREDFRQLIGDVQQLPETQRTALLLREIDALSYEQIAEAMETTVPSVKSLLVRARVSLAEAAEARLLTCEEVRIELGEVAEGLRRTSPPVRRHLRSCERCAMFRKQLRSTNRALAAIFPVAPLVLFKKAFLAHLGTTASAGAGTAAGGVAAGAAAAGGANAMSAGITAIATKTAAGLAAAAIVTAGAVEVDHVRKTARAPQTVAVATAPAVPAPAPAPAVTQPREPVVVASTRQPAADAHGAADTGDEQDAKGQGDSEDKTTSTSDDKVTTSGADEPPLGPTQQEAGSVTLPGQPAPPPAGTGGVAAPAEPQPALVTPTPTPTATPAAAPTTTAPPVAAPTTSSTPAATTADPPTTTEPAASTDSTVSDDPPANAGSNSTASEDPPASTDPAPAAGDQTTGVDASQTATDDGTAEELGATDPGSAAPAVDASPETEPAVP
jgi:RNA polymerase sigma factor (sigma-70 family)